MSAECGNFAFASENTRRGLLTPSASSEPGSGPPTPQVLRNPGLLRDTGSKAAAAEKAKKKSFSDHEGLAESAVVTTSSIPSSPTRWTPQVSDDSDIDIDRDGLHQIETASKASNADRRGRHFVAESSSEREAHVCSPNETADLTSLLLQSATSKLPTPPTGDLEFSPFQSAQEARNDPFESHSGSTKVHQRVVGAARGRNENPIQSKRAPGLLKIQKSCRSLLAFADVVFRTLEKSLQCWITCIRALSSLSYAAATKALTLFGALFEIYTGLGGSPYSCMSLRELRWFLANRRLCEEAVNLCPTLASVGETEVVWDYLQMCIAISSAGLLVAERYGVRTRDDYLLIAHRIRKTPQNLHQQMTSLDDSTLAHGRVWISSKLQKLWNNTHPSSARISAQNPTFAIHPIDARPVVMFHHGLLESSVSWISIAARREYYRAPQPAARFLRQILRCRSPFAHAEPCPELEEHVVSRLQKSTPLKLALAGKVDVWLASSRGDLFCQQLVAGRRCTPRLGYMRFVPAVYQCVRWKIKSEKWTQVDMATDDLECVYDMLYRTKLPSNGVAVGLTPATVPPATIGCLNVGFSQGASVCLLNECYRQEIERVGSSAGIAIAGTVAIAPPIYLHSKAAYRSRVKRKDLAGTPDGGHPSVTQNFEGATRSGMIDAGVVWARNWITLSCLDRIHLLSCVSHHIKALMPSFANMSVDWLVSDFLRFYLQSRTMPSSTWLFKATPNGCTSAANMLMFQRGIEGSAAYDPAYRTMAAACLTNDCHLLGNLRRASSTHAMECEQDEQESENEGRRRGSFVYTDAGVEILMQKAREAVSLGGKKRGPYMPILMLLGAQDNIVSTKQAVDALLRCKATQMDIEIVHYDVSGIIDTTRPDQAVPKPKPFPKSNSASRICIMNHFSHLDMLWTEAAISSVQKEILQTVEALFSPDARSHLGAPP